MKSIRTKLLALGAAIVFIPGITYMVIANEAKHDVANGIREEVIPAANHNLKNLVKIAYQTFAKLQPEDTQGIETALNELNEIVIGKSGYFFILNEKGEYMLSKGRTRDGENIYNAKDSSGNYFIQEIIRRGFQARPGELNATDYYWKNADDPEARKKIAMYTQVPSLGWVICASVYYDDLHSVSDFASNKLQNLIIILLTTISIVGVLSLALFFIWCQMLIKAIKSAQSSIEAMAEYDLTSTPDIQRNDEFGAMGAALIKTMQNLKSIMQQVTSSSSIVNESSSNLAGSSQSLAGMSTEMSTQSRSIAAAGEELSVSLENMGNETTAVESSLTTVASSVEEMSATINEIAKNCAKEASLATNASGAVKKNHETILRLDQSAQAINKISELISSIADQTNLLALNATIEAASAGEAGKGFAVVASEVKQLANQTASATDEINEAINAIQKDAKATIESNTNIETLLGEIANLSTMIASTVEEQTATVSEISGTTAEVATSAKHLLHNIRECGVASREISSNIQQLDAESGEISVAANQTSQSSNQLAGQAHILNEIVEKFKL